MSGRGPARVLRSAGGDRQLHILRGRARRPGNGLGLPTAPASSAQSTAHVADLAQLAMGQQPKCRPGHMRTSSPKGNNARLDA